MPDAISFRPLSRADFPQIQRWLVEPHVLIWWRDGLDLAGVHAKYGPRVDGTDPTHVYMIEMEGRAVGWIQWYLWADYAAHGQQLGATPGSAGIDLAIGERRMTGKGLAPDVIRLFLAQVVFANPDVTAVFADPLENNLRSLHAFEKAGFAVERKVKLEGEKVQRCVIRLDRPQG